MKYQNLREEEIKNKVAKDYFWAFDSTKIIGNLDFCVAMHTKTDDIISDNSLLWAEAKKNSSDVYKSLVQLILTIGKARTFDKFLPPAFLGAFDAEKIAFIPYNDVQEIFYINDFNWNVAPSNHETREFKLILDKVKSIIELNALLFYFAKDDIELNKFIKSNFITGKFGLSKTRIDKNNFIIIYNKWLQKVKPTIAVDWDLAKKSGLIDGDFFLADLLSQENKTLKDKLFVLLQTDHYILDRKLNDFGLFIESKTAFVDNQIAHTQFWNIYERPPKEEYWDYIVERRDLLVPQDVRERKGSFFTPQIWVELSQKYLADVLGVDWQDDYYIWDCAAGTGNLLAGLTNKYNIFASTLDKQDVEVIKDRIQNGANLLEEHVFQFDFLNDEFLPKSKGGKLPDELFNIISNPAKRKKLVVYINPPYAEATDGIGLGGGKIDVSKETLMYSRFGDKLQKAKNELFAQFLIRIYFEIDNALIAQFSTLKHIHSPNFSIFRKSFQAKLEKLFVVPADTFDNVGGQFPIGFFIWNTKIKEPFSTTEAQVFSRSGDLLKTKSVEVYNGKGYINNWIKTFVNSEVISIGNLAYLGNDFQHANEVRICIEKPTSHISILELNPANLIPACIYFSVRHCISASWLNDRDQFLYPNEGWKTDKEFQNDCLAFTLFHSQNKITSKEGVNHWIPFREQEINAKSKFNSRFMTDFINGKIKAKTKMDLYTIGEPEVVYEVGLEFSPEAQEVFDAGRELWMYYHTQPNCNVNASLYDIREHFQGRTEKGKMKAKSTDETYTLIIAELRNKLTKLALKIEPKVYSYGFLR